MNRTVEYEVIVTVRADLVAAWEEYLPGHVADVLATGCFLSAAIDRAAPRRYRCRYTAESQAALERYLEEHTAILRADVLRRFPDGLETTRAVWGAWMHLTP
ncbi:MAG TPA: DUF4286 family protein [Candidatus Krumholzibacteria bacterium]|nr:DUF4286 family protein [Candidatus Krumholzibacteria bacterium]